jgi:hypothetical protein
VISLFSKFVTAGAWFVLLAMCSSVQSQWEICEGDNCVTSPSDRRIAQGATQDCLFSGSILHLDGAQSPREAKFTASVTDPPPEEIRYLSPVGPTIDDQSIIIGQSESFRESQVSVPIRVGNPLRKAVRRIQSATNREFFAERRTVLSSIRKTLGNNRLNYQVRCR